MLCQINCASPALFQMLVAVGKLTFRSNFDVITSFIQTYAIFLFCSGGGVPNVEGDCNYNVRQDGGISIGLSQGYEGGKGADDFCAG